MLDVDLTFPCKKRCGKQKACASRMRCDRYTYILHQFRLSVLQEIEYIKSQGGIMNE